MRLLAAGLFTALLGLTACASTPPQVTVLTSAPPPSEATLEAAPSRVAAFEALPGWSADDHLAALSAFRTACGLALGDTLGVVCERARRLASPSQTTARQFLEANFRPEAVEGEGLLTAYFAPEYEARDRPGSAFTAPVRPRPVDLVDDVSDGAYPDRSQIEARPSTDALAWMRPEDLFFLQIQGSGSLTFPDGRRLNAVYAAHNGRRFSGIATAMRDRGLLADNNTSGSAIHAWLAGHRGDEATAIMRLNPRYVFFRLEPDMAASRLGPPVRLCRQVGRLPSILASTPWASFSGSMPAPQPWSAPFRPISDWSSPWTPAARFAAPCGPISIPGAAQRRE